MTTSKNKKKKLEESGIRSKAYLFVVKTYQGLTHDSFFLFFIFGGMEGITKRESNRL